MEEKVESSYQAHLDAKKRITLRGAEYSNYHVTKYTDGSYKFEPRQLVEPIPEEVLKQIRGSIKAMKAGRKAAPINLDNIPDA